MVKYPIRSPEVVSPHCALLVSGPIVEPVSVYWEAFLVPPISSFLKSPFLSFVKSKDLQSEVVVLLGIDIIFQLLVMSVPQANTHQSNWLPVYRVSALSAVSGFSAIVIGVSAQYIVSILTGTLFIDDVQVWPVDTPDTFSVFNLAVAALTLLTVPTMLTIDRLRKGAFTSMIVVELIWFAILAVLWVAAAGLTADTITPLIDLCKINPRVKILQTTCKDSQVAEAFGFLSLFSLLSYVIILLAQAIMSSHHGHPVWKTSVSRAQFKGSVAPVVNAVHAGVNVLLTDGVSDTPMKEHPSPQGHPVHVQHAGNGGHVGQGQGQGHAAGYFNGALNTLNNSNDGANTANGNGAGVYQPVPQQSPNQLQGYQPQDLSYGYGQQQQQQDGFNNSNQQGQLGYGQGAPVGVGVAMV